jgi:hypothetical protein
MSSYICPNSNTDNIFNSNAFIKIRANILCPTPIEPKLLLTEILATEIDLPVQPVVDLDANIVLDVEELPSEISDEVSIPILENVEPIVEPIIEPIENIIVENLNL